MARSLARGVVRREAALPQANFSARPYSKPADSSHRVIFKSFSLSRCLLAPTFQVLCLWKEELLRKPFCRLAKYAGLFDEHHVTFDDFLGLTAEHLEDMGIVTFGAKRRIIRAVMELRVRRSLFLPLSCT